jgi:hypothetical protein
MSGKEYFEAFADEMKTGFSPLQLSKEEQEAIVEPFREIAKQIYEKPKEDLE